MMRLRRKNECFLATGKQFLSIFMLISLVLFKEENGIYLISNIISINLGKVLNSQYFQLCSLKIFRISLSIELKTLLWDHAVLNSFMFDFSNWNSPSKSRLKLPNICYSNKRTLCSRKIYFINCVRKEEKVFLLFILTYISI